MPEVFVCVGVVAGMARRREEGGGFGLVSVLVEGCGATGAWCLGSVADLVEEGLGRAGDFCVRVLTEDLGRGDALLAWSAVGVLAEVEALECDLFSELLPIDE